MSTDSLIFQIFVTLIYLGYLLVPGYLVLKAFGYRKDYFLLGFGISFSILTLTQIPFRLFGGKEVLWYLLLHGVVILLVLVGLAVRGRTALHRRRLIGKNHRILNSWFLATLTTFSIYHFLVGPYTEIPSDLWARLGNVTDLMDRFREGYFPPSNIIDDSVYMPFLHAAVADRLGVLPIETVSGATLANSLLYLGTIYWFTVRLLVKSRIRMSYKVASSVIAVLLTVCAYGVATFSYVRYYAYFPHMANAALMFVALRIYMDYLEEESTRTNVLLIIGLFLFVMMVNNRQEALFSGILFSGVSIWKMARIWWWKSPKSAHILRRIVTNGIIWIILIAGGFSFSLFRYEIGPSVQPHLIDLGNWSSFLDGVLIANPQLRYWETLGLFGVAIYVWYFIRIRWFKGMDYINFAMASPLITLFNPIFVWWFLHVGTWDSLWRMSYLMPLPIVGSLVVVWTISNRSIGFHRRVFTSVILVPTLVIVSMAPLQIGATAYNKSRLPSLVPVDRENGFGLWSDLILFVDSVDGRRRLVTDSITNYVLSTATRHSGKYQSNKGGGDKDSWQKKFNPFNGDYKDKLLYYGMDDSLIIVNNRDGRLSQSGRLSGHWPTDVLHVTKDYPEELLAFLEQRPDDFKLLWTADRIRVYEVLRNPEHYNN